MNEAVYLLSTVTSLICSILLLRRFWHKRQRLLLWCGLFFCALTMENALLFLDLLLQVDLAWPRRSIALAGVVLVIFGFIRDNK